MSDRLRDTVAERGPGAYVLTVSADGRPHAVYLDVGWENGRLVADVGGSTARNAKAPREISLLFPVRPTRAVFHRHGPAPDPTSSCAADCLPVLDAVTSITIAPPR